MPAQGDEVTLDEFRRLVTRFFPIGHQSADPRVVALLARSLYDEAWLLLIDLEFASKAFRNTYIQATNSDALFKQLDQLLSTTTEDDQETIYDRKLFNY